MSANFDAFRVRAMTREEAQRTNEWHSLTPHHRENSVTANVTNGSDLIKKVERITSVESLIKFVKENPSAQVQLAAQHLHPCYFVITVDSEGNATKFEFINDTLPYLQYVLRPEKIDKLLLVDGIMITKHDGYTNYTFCTHQNMEFPKKMNIIASYLSPVEREKFYIERKDYIDLMTQSNGYKYDNMMVVSSGSTNCNVTVPTGVSLANGYSTTLGHYGTFTRVVRLLITLNGETTECCIGSP